jgi:hypothetical protein
MKRYSYKRADHWEVGLYLIFNSRGNVRMTRGAPGLDSNERALALTLKVPHSLFKVPQLSATITLGEQLVEPQQIDIEAAEAALTEALGARVEITVKETENGA